MNALRSLAVLALLLLSSISKSQALTGTWLAAYYRDQPGNKRIFYYRIYLEQKDDSVYGVCEALDARTDLSGNNPEEAEVVCSFRVYNYNLTGNPDTNKLILRVSEQLNSGPDPNSLPPSFLTMDCRKL